ncbi:cold shock domain-containing protein [Sphaerisporangium fuscum]|uniref:cold shock domain-containing protein n=1 Tax=Sphaerisporangium fuscum TaxID=2835868 RepID=UPI00202998A0|nr:cold shock domain-containing protein [Sphaerisporangium fuscum]
MSVEPVEVATGTVVEWYEEEGWGFIRSADVSGDVFARFSSITGVEGYRCLVPGQRVRFTWEQFPQDGFAFRVIHVFVGGESVPGTPPFADESGRDAYVSRLHIQLDDRSDRPQPGRPAGTSQPDALRDVRPTLRRTAASGVGTDVAAAPARRPREGVRGGRTP